MTYSPGYPVPGVQTQVLVQPHRCSTVHVVVAWVFAVLTLAYMLPWAIAATRHRSNVAAIAMINLFLGWSLVGWVVALVMACGSDAPVVVVQHTYPPPGYGSQPGPGWTQARGYAPYAGPAPTPYAAPAQPALPPAPAAPAAWAEPTRVDPFGTEPTRPLNGSPWQRSEPYGPYEPPPYGSATEPDHRR